MTTRKIEQIWTDDYKGAAQDLVAAGIVKLHELPGQPGRGQVSASYDCRGLPLPKGQAACRARTEAGARSIVRTSEHRYRVSVRVDHETGKRRLAEVHSERRRLASATSIVRAAGHEPKKMRTKVLASMHSSAVHQRQLCSLKLDTLTMQQNVRAADYRTIAIIAACEIDALARLQLLVDSVNDEAIDAARRGLALRSSALADIILSALSPDDAPKPSVAELQLEFYGGADADPGTHCVRVERP